MANPNTPVAASFPIPPPSTALPIARTNDGRDVYLTNVGLEFLQKLWAAIQGQGGALDLNYLVSLETDDPSDGDIGALGSLISASTAMDGEVPQDTVSDMTALFAMALSEDDAPRLTVLGSGGVSVDQIGTQATVSLAPVANLSLLANVSGAADIPSPSTLTAILDACVGGTRGMILVRGASAWSALPLGSNGQTLTSNGTDAVWA